MSISLQEPAVPVAQESSDPTEPGLSRGKRSRPLFDPPIVRRAIVDSFVKLNPATLAKNPERLMTVSIFLRFSQVKALKTYH